jgi:carboxylesterase type B
MTRQRLYAGILACATTVFSYAMAGTTPAPKGDSAGQPLLLAVHIPAEAATPFAPFSTPSSPICVSLPGNTKWAAGANTQLCGLIANNPAGGATGVAYPGIQYANAARWQNPTPYQYANQKAQLAGFGPVCPQALPAGSPLTTNETCQFLNIWIPPTQGNVPPPPNTYPVMVFIHGGAFISGAGSLPVYNGAAFAAHNVIVVTLNYRLGALGFMVSNKYKIAAAGNYGISDQQMALNWVYDNISAFGGDPSRITIFGESAGAMSVGLHLYSIPSSTNLFSAAIMESNPVGLLYQNATATGPTTIGNQFLQKVCATLKKRLVCVANGHSVIMGASADEIVAAQTALLESADLIADARKGYTGTRGLPFQPVIDNVLITGQPSQGYAPSTNPKPAMFGVNQDEGAVFAAFVAAAVAKKLHGKAANNPPALVYNTVVNGGFGSGAAGQFASANSRYSSSPPDYQKGAPYYNGYGQAASNLVLDYDFAQGNIAMANNALAGQGASAKPMYAYYFNQAPLFDIYGHWDATTKSFVEPDNGACAPNIGSYVCHAAELFYVFDTISVAVPPQLDITIPQANLTLAADMNAAWAAFAANPSSPNTPLLANANYTSTSANPNKTGAGAVILNTANDTAYNTHKTPWPTGPIDPNDVYDIWSDYYASPPAAIPAHKKAVRHKHS